MTQERKVAAAKALAQGCLGRSGAPRTVRAFFLDGYPAGRWLDLPGYELEYDALAGTDVYTHESGVKLWTNVIDVSGGAKEKACFIHYTTPLAFLNMTNSSKAAAEVWASLKPENALFGSGIYGSAKGPDEYGSKEAILWNNYRAQIKPGGEWEQMYQDGDPFVWGRVEYGVPIIAAARDVYNAHTQATPEMVHGPGKSAKFP